MDLTGYTVSSQPPSDHGRACGDALRSPCRNQGTNPVSSCSALSLRPPQTWRWGVPVRRPVHLSRWGRRGLRRPLRSSCARTLPGERHSDGQLSGDDPSRSPWQPCPLGDSDGSPVSRSPTRGQLFPLRPRETARWSPCSLSPDHDGHGRGAGLSDDQRQAPGWPWATTRP